MTRPGTESDLAARVVLHLRQEGWTCYAEVAGIPGAGAHRPDIVAITRVPEPTVSICECKRRFGLDVLRQALAWLGWVELVYVATGPVAEKHHGTACAIADGLGIGWLVVDGDGVRVAESAHLRTTRRSRLVLDALRPEQMAYAPGTADGRYYTEHQDRCRRLAEVVAAEPGVDLDRALRLASYPVDRAGRRALATRLRRGYVDRVAARVEGRRIVLWPEEETQ